MHSRQCLLLALLCRVWSSAVGRSKMLLRTSGSRNTNAPAVEVFSRDRFETCAREVPVLPAHPHLFPAHVNTYFLLSFLLFPFFPFRWNN